VVDPLRDIHPYVELMRAGALEISAVIDTHSHADHISSRRALAREDRDFLPSPPLRRNSPPGHGAGAL
jgi:glyoxylase-like metal-dependent hydrolase (beta-lactamase superfamily II)